MHYVTKMYKQYAKLRVHITGERLEAMSFSKYPNITIAEQVIYIHEFVTIK